MKATRQRQARVPRLQAVTSTASEELELNETQPASAGAAGPSDAELVAELDISEAKADSWRRLLALVEEFAAFPHHKQDSTVVPSVDGPNGTFTMGYIAYGPRITEAISLLYAVGAVSPSFPWRQVGVGP
jgi:hypothetical protein